MYVKSTEVSSGKSKSAYISAQNILFRVHRLQQGWSEALLPARCTGDCGHETVAGGQGQTAAHAGINQSVADSCRSVRDNSLGDNQIV